MPIIMNFLSKIIICSEEKARNNSYKWNTISGVVNAAQSVIILMFLTRTVGMAEAGIFTIAYSTASLLYYLGSFGVNNFQVTDVNHKYSFNDYLGTRWFTCALMIAVSLVVSLTGVFTNGYTWYKSGIIFLVCIFRCLDAVESVFTAMYQLNGRLDVGAKISSIRHIVGIAALCITVVISKNLLYSVIACVAVNALLLILFTKSVFTYFDKFPLSPSCKNTKRIMLECFTLFLSGFLTFYIGNAPKYSIDKYMAQDMQAYYGFIAMPVFVIDLMSAFLFQPILKSLADDWNKNLNARFVKRVVKQISIILGLTLLAVIGGYLFGIPVLSVLYGSDLSLYRNELVLMLFGGGMLAVANFVVVVLTIIRRHNYMIFGYIVISVLALFISPVFVQADGITGASWAYVICIGILAFICVVILTLSIIREIASKNK